MTCMRLLFGCFLLASMTFDIVFDAALANVFMSTSVNVSIVFFTNLTKKNRNITFSVTSSFLVFLFHLLLNPFVGGGGCDDDNEDEEVMVTTTYKVGINRMMFLMKANRSCFRLAEPCRSATSNFGSTLSILEIHFKKCSIASKVFVRFPSWTVDVARAKIFFAPNLLHHTLQHSKVRFTTWCNLKIIPKKIAVGTY